MSGPDPLFMVKTAFYIGSFRQCVKDAQKLQSGDQVVDLERDILMYRAYLSEGLLFKSFVKCAGKITVLSSCQNIPRIYASNFIARTLKKKRVIS